MSLSQPLCPSASQPLCPSGSVPLGFSVIQPLLSLDPLSLGLRASASQPLFLDALSPVSIPPPCLLASVPQPLCPSDSLSLSIYAHPQPLCPSVSMLLCPWALALSILRLLCLYVPLSPCLQPLLSSAFLSPGLCAPLPLLQSLHLCLSLGFYAPRALCPSVSLYLSLNAPQPSVPLSLCPSATLSLCPQPLLSLAFLSPDLYAPLRLGLSVLCLYAPWPDCVHDFWPILSLASLSLCPSAFEPLPLCPSHSMSLCHCAPRSFCPMSLASSILGLSVLGLYSPLPLSLSASLSLSPFYHPSLSLSICMLLGLSPLVLSVLLPLRLSYLCFLCSSLSLLLGLYTPILPSLFLSLTS